MKRIIISGIDDNFIPAPANTGLPNIEDTATIENTPSALPAIVPVEKNTSKKQDRLVPHSKAIADQFEQYRKQKKGEQNSFNGSEQLLDLPIEDIIEGKIPLAEPGMTLREYIKNNIRKNRTKDDEFKNNPDKEGEIESEVSIVIGRLLERERIAHQNKKMLDENGKIEGVPGRIIFPAESILALIKYYTRNTKHDIPQSKHKQNQNALLPYLMDWQGDGIVPEEIRKTVKRHVPIPLPQNPDGSPGTGHWGDGEPGHDKDSYMKAAWKKFSEDQKYYKDRDENGKKILKKYDIQGAINFYNSCLESLSLKDKRYYPVNIDGSKEQYEKELKKQEIDINQKLRKLYKSNLKPVDIKNAEDDFAETKNISKINELIYQYNQKNKNKIDPLVDVKKQEGSEYASSLYERMTNAAQAIYLSKNAEMIEKLNNNPQYLTTKSGGYITQIALNPSIQGSNMELIAKLLNNQFAQDAKIKGMPTSSNGVAKKGEGSYDDYDYYSEENEEDDEDNDFMKLNIMDDEITIDKQVISEFNNYLNPDDPYGPFSKNLLSISNLFSDPKNKEWANIILTSNSKEPGSTKKAAKLEVEFMNKYFGIKGQNALKAFKQKWINDTYSILLKNKRKLTASPNNLTTRLSNFIFNTKIILGK